MTVALLGGFGATNLRAQNPCTSSLFVVSSSSPGNLPAAGGTAVVSWHKNSGASASCPSYASTTAPWLTLSTAYSSSTTGSTSVTAAPNPSSGVRSGAISVQSSADDATVFTVYQSGTTLVVDQAQLSFAWNSSAVPASQTINVSASAGAVAITATVTSGSSWLSINPDAAYTPAPLSVSVNPGSLSSGAYQGNIQITGAGLQLNVGVTFVVTANATSLSFSPASGTLSLGAGSTAPSTINANLKNTGYSGTVTFLVTTDQPWLSSSSISLSLGPGQTVPISITASSAALTPGTYTGHVVAQGSSYASTYTLTLTVTGTSIQVSGNPLGLSVSSGSKRTFKNAGQITGGNTTVSIAVTQGGNFLSADSTAQSPGSFDVSVDATHLAAGTYFGALALSCTSLPCVPVTVTIELQVSPGSGSLNFDSAGTSVNGASGSSAPVILKSTLTNSGGVAASVAVSTDQSWLTVTPISASLPAGQSTTIAISTSAANLRPGQYTGHVTAQAPGAAASYTVAFSVAGSSVSVTPNPATLTIAAGTSQTFPAAFQTIGDSAGLTISVTQGNAYFSADPLSQSPGAFNVVVDATKLLPGNYSALLLVKCSPSCIPVAVPVSIVVSQGSSNLIFGSPAANLSGNAGAQAPQTATTTLQNTGSGPSPYSLSFDQTWLTVTPSSGNIAVNQAISLAIAANTSNLPPGSYTGHIMASGGGTVPAILTVNLTVAGVALYVLPSPANFTMPAGTSQTFNNVQILGGSGPVSISITSGSIYIGTDPAVQAPGVVPITVDATYLKPGTYTASLAFQCQQACVPFTLPINITVTSNAAVVFNPPAITITSYQGRPAPSAQTLSVKSSDGSAIPFTINNPFAWLGISALFGTTPATLTLAPNLTGTTAGVSGNLTFTTPNTQATVLLPVVLSIQQFSVNATPNPLNISAVTGAHTQA